METDHTQPINKSSFKNKDISFTTQMLKHKK
jgi:hypothetical protein